MPRFGNKGRFNDRYELNAIFEGMQEELQEFVGQLVEYYRYDSVNSVVDPIYDVGADIGGRRFKKPFMLPVISAGLEEGVEVNQGQGSYTTDVCHLVVSYDQAEKAGLRRMRTDWRLFLGDRFVYNDTVFQVRNIQVRGPIGERYEVLGIDGWQVTADELVYDPDFARFAGPGGVHTRELAEPLLALAAERDTSPENDTAALGPAGDRDNDGVPDTQQSAAPGREWGRYVENAPVVNASTYDDLYGRPS